MRTLCLGSILMLVSSGHEAVKTHPLSTTAPNSASQLLVLESANTTTPIPFGVAPLGALQCQRHFSPEEVLILLDPPGPTLASVTITSRSLLDLRRWNDSGYNSKKNGRSQT
jgi:hypothetical protein